MDAELSLFDTVLDPVEPHIHCLGVFNFGAAIGKAVGGGIVGDDSGRALWGVAYFME